MRLSHRVHRLEAVLGRLGERKVTWDDVNASSERSTQRMYARLGAAIEHRKPPPRNFEAEKRDEEIRRQWCRQQGIDPHYRGEDPRQIILRKLARIRECRAAQEVPRREVPSVRQ